MALSGAHATARAQQSPLIAIKQTTCRTYPVLWGLIRPQHNRNAVMMRATLKNKKLSWCFQTPATWLEVSRGHQT